jgi:hypothetical protein
LGFTKELDKESFELEKIYHTLNLMSLEDLETFKKVVERLKENGQGNFTNASEIYLLSTQGIPNPDYIDPVKLMQLQSLGLVFVPGIWETINHAVSLTYFGQKFKKYLTFSDL